MAVAVEPTAAPAVAVPRTAASTVAGTFAVGSAGVVDVGMDAGVEVWQALMTSTALITSANLSTIPPPVARPTPHVVARRHPRRHRMTSAQDFQRIDQESLRRSGA